MRKRLILTTVALFLLPCTTQTEFTLEQYQMLSQTPEVTITQQMEENQKILFPF